MQWSANNIPTFSQRCRRVILEVFSDLMDEVHQLIATEKKEVTEIFVYRFLQLCYSICQIELSFFFKKDNPQGDHVNEMLLLEMSYRCIG